MADLRKIDIDYARQGLRDPVAIRTAALQAAATVASNPKFTASGTVSVEDVLQAAVRFERWIMEAAG